MILSVRSFTTLALLPLLLVLVGCPSDEADDSGDGGGGGGGGGDGDGGVDCTTDARASLQLSIVNAAGEPITGATGTYSGGGFTDEPCEGGSGVDNLLTCGWEVGGDIDVAIEAAGYNAVSDTWTIPSDECHVQTVQDTVTMESMATTER